MEFAFVSSAFLSLLIGLCYVAIMLFNNMSLEWAVAKAARVAEINSAATQTDISQAVNGYLSSLGLPNATVQYSTAVGSSGLRMANLAASYDQTYAIPMISTFRVTFHANIIVPQPS